MTLDERRDQSLETSSEDGSDCFSTAAVEDDTYKWKKPSSATICPRCQELELDSLMEATVSINGAGGIAVIDNELPNNFRKESLDQPLSDYQQCASAIAQRLVFDGIDSLENECVVCEQLGESDWDFWLPSVHVSGVGESAAPQNFRFEIEGSQSARVTSPAFRNPDGSPLEFGVPSFGSKPSQLLPINLVGDEFDSSMVTSWLKHCQKEHSKCKISHLLPPDKMKKVRLLDVDRRSLVTYTPDKKFIALSYVWGGKDQPIVPAQGPVPEKLPLTIEHAILAVQKLDYQYLWVDSVCIDQGDPIDKAQQIDNMDTIYSFASATFILLDSPHADFGIPGATLDGDSRLTRRKQLTAHFKLGDSNQHMETLLSCHPLLYVETERSPWSKRAWTFQEAHLSRRCIIFTQHQVLFSCNEMEYSEDQYAQYVFLRLPGEYEEDEEDDFDHSDHFPRPLVFPVRDIPSLQYFFDIYETAICRYVSCQMSDQRDALKAISGILSAWEVELSCGKFVFGLPTYTFRRALLWTFYQPDSESERVLRRDPTLFPSWSWCGWQTPSNAELMYVSYDQGVIILPPLSISHNEKTLVSNCGDSKDRGEPYDAATKRWRTTSDDGSFLTLMHDLVSRDNKSCNNIHDPNIHTTGPTILKVQGVLLHITCEEGAVLGSRKKSLIIVNLDTYLSSAGEKDYDVDSPKPVNHYICLPMLLRVHPGLVDLQFIILQWESLEKSTIPRIARRVGTALWSTDAQDITESWPNLEPSWETFYLS